MQWVLQCVEWRPKGYDYDMEYGMMYFILVVMGLGFDHGGVLDMESMPQ